MRVAVPTPPRVRLLTTCRLAAGVTTLAALLVAPLAHAGATNANQRFERIGAAVTDAVAILPMPGYARLLVVERDGDLRLVSGDGFTNELLYHVNVATTCPDEGMLSAAWHPAGPGQLLYFSYITPSPRKMTVGQLIIDGRTPEGAHSNVFQSTVAVPVSCANLGGGLAFQSGKILLGIGDMGNSAAAAQSSSQAGKILRLNDDGTRPPDNPLPSLIFSMGIRNPVELTTDEATQTTYFMDVGPGMNDEVNVVQNLGNYGWPTGTGRQEIPMFVDPIHTWASSVGRAALVAYRGGNLGNAYVGDPLVATGGTGRIEQLDLDPLGNVLADNTLYQPGAGEPNSFRDVVVLNDGYVYLIDSAGELFRFLSAAGNPTEPSSAEGIVPMLVRKVAGTPNIEIGVEREAGAVEIGLYVGDLEVLNVAGAPNWTHGDTADQYLPVDANLGSAWTFSELPISALGNDGSLAYLLVSAQNTRIETRLGYGSNGSLRPGGNHIYACEASCEWRGFGTLIDPDNNPATDDANCLTPFTLNTVLEGPGNNIGPSTVDDTWDCDVILMAISAEWCGPCQAAARDAEDLWAMYRDRGFTPVDIIPEDINGNAADPSTIQRWTVNHGLTFPVLMDEGYRVFDMWWDGGDQACAGWPHIFLFDRQGVQTDFWCGFAASAIHDAVNREVNR